MSNMFCFQCQQTAGNKGCVNTGVCGKQPETARLQDELIGELIRLATAAGKHSRLTDRLLIDGLFTTLTNVNFDDEAIREFTDRVIKERKKLSDEKIPVVALWDGSNDEVSLRSTLLFGLKGCLPWCKPFFFKLSIVLIEFFLPSAFRPVFFLRYFLFGRCQKINLV